MRSRESANWREQGGNVDGEKNCYQELHDDGAQMMHGSTMGVRTGLSFYTSAAQPATPPYLGSLQSFTPENSGLEKSRIAGGSKYVLNLCAGTLHQVFNCCVGEGGWFGNSRPGGSSACMPQARDPPSEADQPRNTGFRNCRSGKRWKYSS